MVQGAPNPQITLQGRDQDGDPLTYDLISPPSGHTLSGSGADRTYVPPAGFVGDVVFRYVAKDHRGLKSVEAQVLIHVNYRTVVACPATVGPTQSRIWPVDGRMVRVGINGLTDVRILYVRQDEKPGKTSDGGPLGGSTTLLRAERRPGSRGGDGRVYLIGYEGGLGQQTGCKGVARVSVPLTRTGKAKSGPDRYDSTKTGAVLLKGLR